MKKILLIVPILAGCASTQSVLSQPADEIVQSDKSVDQVAFCLANKNNVPALDQGGGVKVILIKNTIGGLGMSFTVAPRENGSTIEIRRPSPINLSAHRQCY